MQRSLSLATAHCASKHDETLNLAPRVSCLLDYCGSPFVPDIADVAVVAVWLDFVFNPGGERGEGEGLPRNLPEPRRS